MISALGRKSLPWPRFFTFCDNTKALVNLAGRGGKTFGTTANGPTLTPMGHGYPGLVGDGSTSTRSVSFGPFAGTGGYWGDQRSLTVMARVKARTPHIGAIANGRTAGTGLGWSLFFSNFGAAEDGFNFVVFDGAGNFLEAQDGIGSSIQQGKDLVVAGTYDHKARSTTLWTRQPLDPHVIKKGTDTNTNAGSPHTVNWDVRGTGNLMLLKDSVASLPFDGSLGWVAVWDRVLHPAELQAWSRDEDWPFLHDEFMPFADIAATYRNSVAVSQAYSPLSPVNYTTGVDALASFSGDLISVPNPSGAARYKTGVNVGQAYAGSAPELVRWVNRVSVGQVYTSGAPVVYTTRVGVGQRTKGLLDGRVALLGTARYRR